MVRLVLCMVVIFIVYFIGYILGGHYEKKKN